jgi:CHAT domain-containing protein
VASLFGPLHERTEPTPDIPDGTAVVYARKGACEEQVKRLLVPDADARKKPGWQYLLFSTHGFSDTRNGMLSCVVLSTPDEDSAEDGFLQAHEVLNMDLDTDLVMLSACQTGLGRLRSGEGLVGLSAAFFCAGAKSVCASLWSVPSRATKELVTEFFKRLRDGNTDRAEALRQAQLAVMRSGDARRDPWHWAAFVLMGDYR